jgi:hypothetical protein
MNVPYPAIVTWHDAHGDTERSWLDISEPNLVDEPFVVNSVGWLLPESHGGKQGHVSLALSWSPADFVDMVLHIPEAMVQSVKVLESKKNGKVDGQRQTMVGDVLKTRRTKGE